MEATLHGSGPMAHYNRLRAYLVRRRRAQKPWSQQHEDAWQVLKSVQELLAFLEAQDRRVEGGDIHLTILLRTYGRETEADRRRTPKFKLGKPPKLNPMPDER